jgi:hypothetical protein
MIFNYFMNDLDLCSFGDSLRGLHGHNKKNMAKEFCDVKTVQQVMVRVRARVSLFSCIPHPFVCLRVTFLELSVWLLGWASG